MPVLAGMNLLENHDIPFRRNEFLVDAEGHTRSVPLRRSPSGHRILNLLLQRQRAASCFSHATAGDFSEDPREQNLNVSSACMFGLSRHPFSRVCQHSNPASVTSHRSWSILVSTHSNPTDLDWTRAFAHDGRDPRSWPHTKPWSRTACTGTELHCKRTRSVDQLREMCPSPALRHQTHGPDDVGGSGANVTSERQRLHGEGGEGHDCRSRGTEVSKEEGDTTNNDRVQHCVQFWSGIQCDDQLGNSMTQRNFDTTITSVLPDNSSLAPQCREHPPEGKDESPTGKCTDDGRGLVKTLSGRLARKLQRSASLVNAGLSKNIQTVLDAATVDRCDFFEICCSDAPCLTEVMQRRGLSSFSLLRSDGVGNHHAQTREKIVSWLTEKRPQKAWFSPPVVTHQNNSTRCSFRSRRIFDSFSCMLQQSCVVVVTFIRNGLQSASVGRLSSCVNSGLSRKAVVENCL